MLRKKKKIFKILSVLVAVIIAFSSFIVSVSAVTEDENGYYFNIQQPVANSNSGYIEIVTENWGPMLIYFNASFQHSFHENNVNDGAFNFYARVENNCLVIRNQGQIGAVDGYNNTQYLVIWGFFVRPDGVTGWRTTSYDQGTGLSNTFNINLTNPGAIIKARGYNCNLNSLGLSENNNFKPFVYGSDTALYNQMKVMEELIRSSIAGNQAIINNADKNASNIQSNADKNASQIQQNQDKNTNKVINGGSDNPHYSAADTSTTDDYADKEKELNNKTVSARSSTVSFFNNFGAMLNDTNVSRGLLAVSKVMTELFSVGWLAGIIQFALALGAFAFILGSVIMVVGRLSGKEARDTRNRYYKAKTDYYNSRRKK